MEIRNEIAEHGWEKVVAFQTRNPMHRAHEELCRMAMEQLEADGVLIHMLLGKLKPGDIPADVRDASIRKMVDVYFPPNTVMVTGYGFDMLYAGPGRRYCTRYSARIAVVPTLLWVATTRVWGTTTVALTPRLSSTMRCPAHALELEIFRADHTAYSKKLNKVVMMCDVPDHTKDDFVLLSGTAVREMLGKGIAPPPEFSRPEVAKILSDYYQSLDAG